MLRRRQFLFCTLSGFAAACSKRSEAPPPHPSPAIRQSTHAGVDFLELFPNGADASAPLIVAIHGMGDRPENWVDSWRSFPAKVHIALPRAFRSFGDGFSWFEFREGMSDTEFGTEVGNAEEKLWKAIASLAGTRKVLVTGFSQGGILSFAIAARRVERVICAFPVAGSLPGSLLPNSGTRTAKVIALHGTADRVVAFKWGKATVDALKERGNDASLKTYADVGHTMTAEMRSDLWSEIGRALPPAQ